MTVVLAAGQSSRMGPGGSHKLLAEFDGIPLVRRSALIALSSLCRSVIVVTGYREEEIRAAVADLDVQMVSNADHLSGMASSIVCGVTLAEQSQADGMLIMLADMPALSVTDLNHLIATFRQAHCQSIVRAAAEGVPGNPVIFPRPLFERLKGLSGDRGAREVVESAATEVIDVEIGAGASVDVDTPAQIIAEGGVVV